MLSDHDRRILDFERAWWLFPGPKDRAITDELGITSADYYHRLRELLTDPDAYAYDPLTVRRLRKVQTSARSVRTAGE